MKSYKRKELLESLEFASAKERALKVWQYLSEEAARKYGDAGCCTLGGGIYMYIVEPRCRVPKRRLVLSSPCHLQGEVPKYAGMKEAADVLRVAGFECQIDYGRMD